MKKSIASVLCLVLLIGILFAGCGGDNNAPATIEGKWKGQIDMASLLNTQLAAASDASIPGLEFANIALPYSMEFTADGKVTMNINDSDIEAMATAIIDQMVPALDSYAESMGASLDDLIAMSGMSKDDFMKQMAGALTQSMDLSALNMTENYKTENGILYIGEDLEDADENPYTLDGNKLTIQAAKDAGDEAFMFPLVLERVN